MSFQQNLINARSHLVFLAALGFGLLLVTKLETNAKTEEIKNGDPLVVETPNDPMDAFDAITPLPLAITGTSSEEDIAYATIAWRYFENNTNPSTGLVNSADKYPSTTMWETGSYFIAVISAELLGLISPDEATSRIDLALNTLSEQRLYGEILPNKAYNVSTGELVDYANQPSEEGLGWSALDVARIVATLAVVEHHHPDLAPSISKVIAHWDLSRMVNDGQLFGGNISENGLREDQEGRVGYEQYAAKAMMTLGYNMYRSYNAEDHLMTKEVYGQPIPVDTRLHRNVTPAFTVSEPYVFDGLEFGFDARSARFATAIYQAQENRYRDTGVLTAVSESHIDEAPYFIYSTVWGGGAPWAVLTFQGERLDSKRTTSTKIAFAWDALFGTDYTRELMAAIAPVADPERGWPEGIYEIDGSTNASFTTNTNAVVLASLAFRANGPLLMVEK
ncbi:DUF3131 domain-containing protein [Yoonia maritima]|uniref:DUF3131 domain-containing protein n=1 Tax=Yoonia maritima TaxID=1435347 RepID=UPI000D0F6BDF|nr:DUF3131 domain-containing protein [Yoonia maritima]